MAEMRKHNLWLITESSVVVTIFTSLSSLWYINEMAILTTAAAAVAAAAAATTRTMKIKSGQPEKLLYINSSGTLQVEWNEVEVRVLKYGLSHD